MHNHTIDWYRQLNLTPDALVAQKRWETAVALGKKLSRTRVIELLRLFLFAPTGTDFTRPFTNELIALDPEYPVSNNTQELRMIAGLAMIAIFDKPSKSANAFALGLRAASFPDRRLKPIQPAILTEAEEYLHNEAGRLRPDEFATDVAPEVLKTLLGQGKALVEAGATADEAKKAAALASYHQSIPSAIAASHRVLASRIQQLAEEGALLWWVLSEFSDALQRPTCKLSPEAYAFAVAAEAAQRTIQLPPPPSIGPLLARALQPCKRNDRRLALSDYVKAVDPAWRANFHKSINVSDCRDLSPLCTALERAEGLGRAAALKTLSKDCPGVKGEALLTPAQAAQQFYNEILFLRALGTLPS